METPLAKAVDGYLARDRCRLHMPGHKGNALFPVGEAARYDITEVEGADSLYEAAGAIAQTEREYAALYGSWASLISAGGSTLCIQAMLALACPPGSKVVAARGVHTAAVNAMALLDLHPSWIWPEQEGELGGMTPVTPEQVAAALQANPDGAAVYITSPNYFGLLCDIAGIGAVCRAHGVPLLVDNAHGAHLKFLRHSLHPLDLGADLCCDSLHKTLPALTGGALLHIGNRRYVSQAKRRMALFGSTSPSYLIMLSVDGALPYLRGEAAAGLEAVRAHITRLEGVAREKGFLVPAGARDPARLTLGFGAAGFTGRDFGIHLRACGIEPELLGERFAVLLASPWSSQEDFLRLERALLQARTGRALPWTAPSPERPRQALSLREAVLAPVEEVPVEESPGRIAGAAVCPCPPGIPLVVPGERIAPSLPPTLKSAGIFRVNVIK